MAIKVGNSWLSSMLSEIEKTPYLDSIGSGLMTDIKC